MKKKKKRRKKEKETYKYKETYKVGGRRWKNNRWFSERATKQRRTRRKKERISRKRVGEEATFGQSRWRHVASGCFNASCVFFETNFQTGLNGVKPAIPPRDQKRAPARPPKDNLRLSTQNNNVESTDNANAEPTQQQLHSIRKYQVGNNISYENIISGLDVSKRRNDITRLCVFFSFCFEYLDVSRDRDR